MSVIAWNPDPAPFGNAAGLDTVSLDVKRVIAERFGVSITVGALPADIDADQPARLAAAIKHYGDRRTDHSGDTPFAAVTISHDGLSVSGEHADGNGHTSGSVYHYWDDRIGPETVVFDCRSVSDADIVRYAVRGPMLGVTLPFGTVCKLGPIPEMLKPVADAYLAAYGSLAATEG
jgi:hypothetical protein